MRRLLLTKVKPMTEKQSPEQSKEHTSWWRKHFNDNIQSLVDPSDAPETYENFIIPEDMEIQDKELMDEFCAVAQALNLTQRQAQKMIELYIKQQQRSQDLLNHTWEDTHKEWTSQLDADPELGGASQKRTLKRARMAIDAFGTPSLMNMLDYLNLGNNPEFLRFFARVGQMLEEDNLISQPLDANNYKEKSLSERLWPK